MSWSPLFFSLSIFEPVIVFPPRLCVSAFFIFFTPLIFRVRLQPQTDLVCMLAPPTPRGVYIKGECGALSSSPDLCDSSCRVGIGRCYSNSARGRRCLTDRKYVFFLLCGVSNTERKHIVCDCVHSPILFLIGLKAGRDTVTRTYTHPTHTRRRIDISTAVLLFLFLRLRTPHFFFFFVLYFEILVMIFLRSCLWPYIASLRLRRGV